MKTVMIFPYLDDGLIKAPTQQEAMDATQSTIALFTNLVLQINRQKSTLIRVQQLEFIGAYLNCPKAVICLLHQRFTSLINLISTIRDSPQTSATMCYN